MERAEPRASTRTRDGLLNWIYESSRLLKVEELLLHTSALHFLAALHFPRTVIADSYSNKSSKLFLPINSVVNNRLILFLNSLKKNKCDLFINQFLSIPLKFIFRKHLHFAFKQIISS